MVYITLMRSFILDTDHFNRKETFCSDSASCKDQKKEATAGRMLLVVASFYVRCVAWLVGCFWHDRRFDSACDDLRNVFDLHFLFGLDALDAIFEHGDTEGAASSQHLCIRLQGLIDARLVNALADFFLHPDTTAAAAAAEALAPVATHFRDAIAIKDGENATWLIVSVIVATNITGVMICELACIKALWQVELLIVQ
jgi:hypothetical protein